MSGLGTLRRPDTRAVTQFATGFRVELLSQPLSSRPRAGRTPNLNPQLRRRRPGSGLGHRGAAGRPAGGATGTTRTPGPPHPHQPKPRGGWRRRRLDWDDSNPRPAGAAPSPHPSQPKPAAARRLAPPAPTAPTAPTEGGPAGLPFSGRPGRPPAAAQSS